MSITASRERGPRLHKVREIIFTFTALYIRLAGGRQVKGDTVPLFLCKEAENGRVGNSRD